MILFAVRALMKTEASDDLPKQNDITMRLCTTLASVWDGVKDCTHDSLMRAAKNLSKECEDASSLEHIHLLAAYLPATKSPKSTELSARLEAKRIDKSRLLKVLEIGLNQPASLSADPKTITRPRSGSSDLIFEKG